MADREAAGRRQLDVYGGCEDGHWWHSLTGGARPAAHLLRLRS